jgi:ankyrin repeat protein
MSRLQFGLAVVALCSVGSWSAAGQTRSVAPSPFSAGKVAPLTAAVFKRELPQIRQLLDAGEDPNRKDDQGFSPWMWAVNFEDNDALTLLLEKVPAILAEDAVGRRRLAMTASLNNLVAARALLSKGVPVDSPAIDGATPLLVAAASGYTGLMQVFLAAGANPNSQDQHGDSPLMAAVRIGSIDAVTLLLHARADANDRDTAGRAALHWAARTGRADIVRLLLDEGATIDLVDDSGRTAMAYARERGYSVVVDVLRANGAKDTAVSNASAKFTPREAVEQSLPLLVRGWQTWTERQSCGACHHRLMIDRVAAIAKARGFAAATPLADDQVKFFTGAPAATAVGLRQQLSTDEGVIGSALGIGGDGSSGDALNLNAMLELGVPRSELLEARAILLAGKQMSDGSWRNGLPRVPVLSSDITTTAVAARAIAAYGGSADAAEINERIEHARQWLVARPPVTTDDKASRLLGLRWTHADERVIASAAELLTREQHADGGWSQLPGVNSDAYATGMVLVALRWGIGLPATDPLYQHGVEYLLRTQEPDGSWFVHKRAAASNAYFESGFPHGKFQFISYAGSCWATMALMYAAAPVGTVQATAPQRPGDQVSGAEFVAGANLVEKNVKAEGTVFVPDNVRRVRAVIVLAESWPESERGAVDLATGLRLPDRPLADLAVGRFRDQAWRRLSRTTECALLHLRLGTIRAESSAGIEVNGVLIRNGVPNRVVRDAAAGGADALLVILQRLAEESAHQELKDAPVLLWGWSASASFGTTFAAGYPERTVAFVRYHTHLRGLSPELNVLKYIPALLVAGGKDQQAGTEDAETFWKRGRSSSAPWTFAIEPEAPHASEEMFESSQDVMMIPWIASVLRQRLALDSTQLLRVDDTSGWLGNNRSGEIGPYAGFAGQAQEASWLPDERTARGWQSVLGAPNPK